MRVSARLAFLYLVIRLVVTSGAQTARSVLRDSQER